MILVDTSVWVDHLRHGDQTLAHLLVESRVLGHPAVIGELGLDSLSNRVEILGLLANLPPAVSATDAEMMQYVEIHTLYGRGIGFVDAHLLASTALTPGATLWTRDKRLRAAATSLGTLASPR